MLLPLRPAAGYPARVLILGGGNPATATTEILDMSAPTPQWHYGPSMSQARIEMNATILPDGKVLATGGSSADEDATTASFNADLYDPDTNTFSSAAANAFARLYHSNALLLPDATVLLTGGNPSRGSYEQHMEIYSPAYLFNADESPAVRPSINSVTPAFGKRSHVPGADAGRGPYLVGRAGPARRADSLLRHGSTMIKLSFTAGAGELSVTAPPNGNLAPPGYYMLFDLTFMGVPSVATFAQLSASIQNQAPTATITSPATNMTVNPGQSISFSGDATDSDGTISVVLVDVPWWQPRFRVGGESRQRAYPLRARSSRRSRPPTTAAWRAHCFTYDHGSRFHAVGHTVFANRVRRRRRFVQGHSDSRNRLYRGRDVQRQRTARRRHRYICADCRDRFGIHDAQRQHLGFDTSGNVLAGHYRDDRRRPTSVALENGHPDRANRRLLDFCDSIESDGHPRQIDDVHSHGYSRSGILQYGKSVRDWRTRVCHHHVRAIVHLDFGHVHAHRGDEKAGPERDVNADHYGIRWRSSALDNRHPGDAMSAARITRRSLLHRIGAGAALAAVPGARGVPLPSPWTDDEQAGRIVRLDRNENALRASPRAVAALRDAAGRTANRYPGQEIQALQKRLSDLHNVEPDQIVLGWDRPSSCASPSTRSPGRNARSWSPRRPSTSLHDSPRRPAPRLPRFARAQLLTRSGRDGRTGG